MRQWRLLCDGPAPGARNMALDEALLQEVRDVPVLRFYGWQPACLSLGYGQRSRLVDARRLRERHMDLVRRPSGGGAILHDRELTWSLVIPAAHPLATGSLQEGYRRIAEVLSHALRTLGIPVAMAQENPGQGRGGPACFAMPAVHELTVAGRKLLGSARVQRRHGLLQHGSLPLAGDVAAICDLLRYENDLARRRDAARLRERATTLSAVSDGQTVSAAQVRKAMLIAFNACCGANFRESGMTGREQDLAHELERERYGNPVWVRRR